MTSTEFVLPQLPFGSAKVTIVRWLKRASDSVAVGEPLLVVVNDRVEAALPATCAGIFERPLVAEGATVQAGAPVASILATTIVQAGYSPYSAPSHVRISPVARSIAKFHDIDITELRGSGVAGRIVKADVLAALVTPLSAAPSLGDLEGHAYAGASLPIFDLPSPISDLPLPASLVTRHASPSTYILTATEIDLECLTMVIAQHAPHFTRRRLDLSYIACVALGAVAALSYYPLLNSAWADTMIVARRRVHLGLVRAAAAPRCVRDAQDLNLRGLARALGGAAPQQSDQDYTFVIADLGDQVWGDPAALVGGGVAALGLGAVRARPLVLDDGGVERLAVRHVALLTLAFDARVLDQHYADAFLRDLKRRLEHFYF